MLGNVKYISPISVAQAYSDGQHQEAGGTACNFLMKVGQQRLSKIAAYQWQSTFITVYEIGEDC